MLGALGVATVVAILAIAPAGAHGFGGSRGFNSGGGFQGFNPGGFQGFNPAGFQGFNPGPAGRSFMPPRFSNGRPFPHQFHRPFATNDYVIGAYGAPFYYDSSTLGGPLSSDAPVYAPPAVYTAPPIYIPVVVPIASGAMPAAPARPSVIEYSEGRYEFRGDGVNTPYNWVWIPNPPTAPPVSVSLPPAPSTGDRSPARRSQLYRWVDEQGVVHLTDNADIVPEQFRKQAKPNNSL